MFWDDVCRAIEKSEGLTTRALRAKIFFTTEVNEDCTEEHREKTSSSRCSLAAPGRSDGTPVSDRITGDESFFQNRSSEEDSSGKRAFFGM
jgi:hypothetical protein